MNKSRKIRKTIALLIVAILLVGILPLTASAARGPATLSAGPVTIIFPNSNGETATVTNIYNWCFPLGDDYARVFTTKNSTVSFSCEVYAYNGESKTIAANETINLSDYYRERSELSRTSVSFQTPQAPNSSSHPQLEFELVESESDIPAYGPKPISEIITSSSASTTGNTPPSTSTSTGVTPGTKTIVYSGSDFKIEETVIAGDYDQISNFYPNGTAGVSIGGKWGFIDSTGKVLVEPKYTTFWGYSEGDLVAVPNSSGKWGFVNTKTGAVAIPFDYDMAYSFSEGLAAVEKDGKIGFINTSNKFVIDAKYDSSFDFSEGHSSASINEKYGVIDKNGKTVVPFEYDYLGAMMDGMMVAMLNDKWGYIDITGKVVVDIKYDGCFTYFEGVGSAYYAKDDGVELVYIDKEGKILHTFSGALSTVGPFSEGISRITDTDNNAMFIDKNFNEIFSLPAPGAWTDYQEGLATRWRYGYISFFDKTGKELSMQNQYWLWARTDGGHIMPQFNNGILATMRADGDHPWVILKKTSAGTATATPPTSTPPSSQTVSPTASTVYVNGVAKAFEAYYIGGNNFFKLRDLAFVLNGTEKQFEVGYDNETKAITLTSGEAYTAVSGEMVQGDGKSKTATPTPSKIYLDGKELNFVVYNIGGNNFFKLRDLMDAIDVYVGYDNTAKSITLDTSKGYVAE